VARLSDADVGTGEEVSMVRFFEWEDRRGTAAGATEGAAGGATDGAAGGRGGEMAVVKSVVSVSGTAAGCCSTYAFLQRIPPGVRMTVCTFFDLPRSALTSFLMSHHAVARNSSREALERDIYVEDGIPAEGDVEAWLGECDIEEEIRGDADATAAGCVRGGGLALCNV
jgi:hypothetical protein